MSRLNQIELALAGGMLAVSPWIINAAPYESTMGLVQKIFYYHMPAAWLFVPELRERLGARAGDHAVAGTRRRGCS